jgi:hypothetical protein
MSSKKKVAIIAVVVLLAAGAEVAYRRTDHGTSGVEILNQGDATLENLVVTYGKTRIPVGNVPPGHGRTVRIKPGERGFLRLDYEQRGQPVQGFQVPEYDPAQHLRDGFKLVLTIKNSEFQRGMEDDEYNPPETAMVDKVVDWIRWAIASP